MLTLGPGCRSGLLHLIGKVRPALAGMRSPVLFVGVAVGTAHCTPRHGWFDRRAVQERRMSLPYGGIDLDGESCCSTGIAFLSLEMSITKPSFTPEASFIRGSWHTLSEMAAAQQAAFGQISSIGVIVCNMCGAHRPDGSCTVGFFRPLLRVRLTPSPAPAQGSTSGTGNQSPCYRKLFAISVL